MECGKLKHMYHGFVHLIYFPLQGLDILSSRHRSKKKISSTLMYAFHPLECDLRKTLHEMEKNERWRWAQGGSAESEWKSHLLFLNKKWHECEITLEEIFVNNFFLQICSPCRFKLLDSREEMKKNFYANSDEKKKCMWGKWNFG